MPNLASTLKAEIARVARKELRDDLQSLRKIVATQRSEIASLKRRTQAAEQQLRRLGKSSGKALLAAAADETTETKFRFSAAGLKAQRQRLGLSARECGLLVGASELSIYKWEGGKAEPQHRFVPALASLRTLGKKEAAARLASL